MHLTFKTTNDACTFEEWNVLAKGYIHEDIIEFLNTYPKHISFNGSSRLNPTSWSYISKIYENHWSLDTVFDEIDVMSDRKTANAFKRFIVKKYELTTSDLECGDYVFCYQANYSALRHLKESDMPSLLDFHHHALQKGYALEQVYTVQLFELLSPLLMKYGFGTSIQLCEYVLPKVSFTHDAVVNSGVGCTFMIDFAHRIVTRLSTESIKTHINRYADLVSKNQKVTQLSILNQVDHDFSALMKELASFGFTVQDALDFNGPFAVGKIGHFDYEELLPFQTHKMYLSKSAVKDLFTEWVNRYADLLPMPPSHGFLHMSGISTRELKKFQKNESSFTDELKIMFDKYPAVKSILRNFKLHNPINLQKIDIIYQQGGRSELLKKINSL